MPKNETHSDSFARRARRSSREILLAIALTLAAVACIIAATSGSNSETASVVGATGTAGHSN